MIRVSLLLIAGGVAAQHSRVPLSSDLCKLCLVASILLLCRPQSRGVACVLVGFLVFMQAGLGIVDARIDPQFAGDSLLTRVCVVDFPVSGHGTVTMLVTPVDDERLPPLSRVSWHEPPQKPTIGQTWQLELRLRRPRGYSNPGVFDYEAWLFRQGIHATGYVVPGKRNRLLNDTPASRLDRLRDRFVRQAVDAADAPGASAVLAAIGVGARHLVTQAQWERFASTGTSHLMAISGLHVGLAAMSVFVPLLLLLGLLRIGTNPYVIALAGGAIAAGAYAVLSGLGVPSRRALLMLALIAVTVARRRQVDPAVTLAAAGVAVFLVDPVATMTPGFDLSFAAVALLIWLARRDRPTPASRMRRTAVGIGQLVTMQFILLFGLMPLTISEFRRIAPLSVPANLVAVPLFSFVTVPLALGGLLAGTVSDMAAGFLLHYAAASISGVEALIVALSRLPAADVRVADTSGGMALVVMLPAVWAALPRGFPVRGLALLAVVALVLHRPAGPPRDCFDTHVLDVGQGLAVVVQTESHVLVYDTGLAFRSGGSLAERVVRPFLQSKGTRRIDRLVISHGDADHSGGLPDLLDDFDVREVLAGEPLDAAPAAERCIAGQEWRYDGVRFRTLHPDEPGTGNNTSCVLLVAAGEHRLLLTGDIEAQAEHEILRQKRLPRVDALVVPHHGSLTSSSVPFVNATAPGLAVVSSGFGNRWGFPKPKVRERWAAAGALLLDTASSGAVSFRSCAAGGLSALRRDRRERRRFWRGE